MDEKDQPGTEDREIQEEALETPEERVEETEQDQDSDEVLGEKGIKALRAERKSNRELRAQVQQLNTKFADLENRSAKILEQLEKENNELKARAEEASAQLTKAEIARKYKLSDEDTALLVGDVDTMEALAGRLSATYREVAPGEGSQPEPVSEDALLKQAAEEGDVQAAMAIKAGRLLNMRSPKKER